jgi:antibiotic biosynthesis monooxygenase (ABM) superfamily enzyme
MSGLDDIVAVVAGAVTPLIRIFTDMRVIALIAICLVIALAWFVLIPLTTTALWWLIRTVILVLTGK